jgi:hypothetical protein
MLNLIRISASIKSVDNLFLSRECTSACIEKDLSTAASDGQIDKIAIATLDSSLCDEIKEL